MSADASAPLSDEQLKALWGEDQSTVTLAGIDGSPVGDVAVGNGCVSVGVGKIFGSVENYVAYLSDRALVEDLDHRSFSNLLVDPGALQVASEWRSCMEGAGYFYTLPFMAANDDYVSPRPGQKEQQIAAQDASCRVMSEVDGELLAYEAQYSAGLAERNTPGLGDRVANWVRQINAMDSVY